MSRRMLKVENPVAAPSREWHWLPATAATRKTQGRMQGLAEVLVVVHQIAFADEFEAFVAEHFGGRVDIFDVDGD
jgi:hypothetical protein